MVMVEITVPSLDKEYDFKLDEHARIDVLIEEIAEVVCRSEQSQLSGDEKQLVLCDIAGGYIFEKEKTLYSYGIVNGSKLMLV